MHRPHVLFWLSQQAWSWSTFGFAIGSEQIAQRPD